MKNSKEIRKYQKLASRAEALLDAETAKPLSERDDALADEYAKTVLYAREGSKRFRPFPYRKRR